MSNHSVSLDVVALRPFVPAKDFDSSASFYTDLGFTSFQLGEGLASMHLGPFAFLLQKFDVEGFASNFMMHLLVNDVDAWWSRIDALDLAGRYGVEAPRAPKLEPWGLRVTYVFDPSGVLWHIAEDGSR
ncbi:VOC family protein [Paraburkholderia nodosa]|uniref:VOC family protein n=1 Tax=Paraburkholderia nodosa TaxID=392320 RepID=UPI0008415CE9|nr:VOC family protein [Paraburkholderia nodosa]